MSNGLTLPIQWYGVQPPDEATVRRVRLYVCGRYPADTARVILDALGLLPEPTR